MREILFRGKATENNGICTPEGEWIKGHLVNAKNAIEDEARSYIIEDAEYYTHGEFSSVYEVDPETVGQFTGLYDSTKWEDLTEAEKKQFYHKNNSEDGITIKYPKIESVKHLWKGKPIFDGDIGRYKQTDGAKRNGKPIICTGKVVYWAKTVSFAVESKDEKGVEYFDYFPIKDFEIIGNIHDNPELLEREDKK